MKKLIICACLLLGLSIVLYVVIRPAPKAIIRNQTIILELAVTPKEKERGLGYRDRLEQNHGMLFIYDHKERYSFWMKGMRFPLDMIWIDGSTVVDISPNVPLATDDKPNIRQSAVPVDKVLELNAGSARELGITVGDQITFSQW